MGSSILDDQLVTIAEAALLLRVAPSTVRRRIRKGLLSAQASGHQRITVRLSEVERMAEHLRVAGSPAALLTVPQWTPQRREEAFAAVQAAKALQRDLLKKRDGRDFPPSWELIHEGTDESGGTFG